MMKTAALEMSQQETLVRISGLNHWFGQGDSQKQVLYDINLDLAPGEIVIMTGPSGSGKTTLLTLIGGLRSIQDGNAAVFGEDLRKLDADCMVTLRKRIGFIFQAHNLFDSLTACQNVKLALELHNYTPDRRNHLAVDILERIGLAHRLNYKPQSLSGGQRQRVAIARAIVNRPKLILADEPTAALDKDSSHEVLNLLKLLAREEQSTILIVTHDNRILDAADRIINMVDGSIVSNLKVKQSIEICEYLANCPFFMNSSPEVLTEIAQKMIMEKFSNGDVIIRQGDIGDKFYILCNGILEVTSGLDGKLSTLKPGDFFGETALLEDRERTATVLSVGDSRVYSLKKPDFIDAMNRSESFRSRLLDVLFNRH